MLTVNTNRNKIIQQAFWQNLSTVAPLPPTKATGRDTTGLIGVKLNDNNNTIIFCETSAEANRVKAAYQKHINNLGKP